MQFGLFGGARTKRSDGAADSHAYGDFIAYVERRRAAGLSQRLPRRAPFHRRRPGLGLAEPAGLSGGAHPQHPARHRRRRAAVAQPGAAGRTGRDASTCCRTAGSISASARATAPTSSPASASRWTRRPSASTRRSRSSARPGPARAASRTTASAGATTTSSSSRRRSSSRTRRSGWPPAARNSIRRAAREGYNLLLDQLGSVDAHHRARRAVPRGMPGDRPRLRPGDGRRHARAADRAQRGGAQARLRDPRPRRAHHRRPGARRWRRWRRPSTTTRRCSARRTRSSRGCASSRRAASRTSCWSIRRPTSTSLRTFASEIMPAVADTRRASPLRSSRSPRP